MGAKGTWPLISKFTNLQAPALLFRKIDPDEGCLEYPSETVDVIMAVNTGSAHHVPVPSLRRKRV